MEQMGEKEVRMRTTMTRIKNRNTTPPLPSKDSRLGEVGGARGGVDFPLST
jgi:hypothetical protein